MRSEKGEKERAGVVGGTTKDKKSRRGKSKKREGVWQQQGEVIY